MPIDSHITYLVLDSGRLCRDSIREKKTKKNIEYKMKISNTETNNEFTDSQ